jgi:phage protein D
MNVKKLHEFESKYDDFYVPVSAIKVGGQDLVRELLLTVTSVEVELKINAPGRFSFTVASAFDWTEREFLGGEGLDRVDLLDLFAFGAEVEVRLGYNDPASLVSMITGIVTEVGTSFAESGTPALTVSGYDALYPLGIGKKSDQWDDKKPSDAVREVAEGNSLAVKITTEEPVEKRIDQTKESDRDFIDRMAKLAKAIYYFRDGALHLNPRRNDEDAVAELAWGEGLSSFSPTANIARQITEVEVSGWSAEAGKRVVGKAKRGDEKGVDGSTESGAQYISKAFGRSTVLAISAAVHSQQEADERAKAILEERAQDFVTGDGECVGLPVLLPDTNVKISGIGRAFNKTYYVTDTTHTLDGKGYRCRFKVREPSL